METVALNTVLKEHSRKSNYSPDAVVITDFTNLVGFHAKNQNVILLCNEI